MAVRESKEFNVDLPPRYMYDKDKSVEENLKDIDDYILALHTSLDELLKKMFTALSDVADSATANNIALVDEDGNVIDSGKTVSTDGTFAANSDLKVPTEKAIKTYGDANWA